MAEPQPSFLRRLVRPPWVFLLVALVALLGALLWLNRGGPSREELTLAEFREEVAAGQVETATIGDRSNQITGELADGTRYRTTFPGEFSDEITTELLEAGVPVEVDNQRPSIWSTLALSLLPTLLVLGVLAWFLTQTAGGRSVMQMSKSRARRFKAEGPQVTFADVAGIDEAVDELREIREFLAEPARFHDLGARIPKGVLLYGPPGTGKTLLAKAVAGEAGVPFFSISGSDFVEMFVGVGAARVRDLFAQAKAAAPAIVFVDEIDAVGRHRGAGLGGGHDEREQTLNQLLVEMDGFGPDSGVVLIAGTNRPDILDPALLRPGRFDRHIAIDRPDVAGREAILSVHLKGKPMEEGVSAERIARRTPGFTGADLANVVNEGAILAARRGARRISGRDLEQAVERVIAGPERKSRVMPEAERRRVAYHEVGHALVGHVLPNGDPVHKISVVSRGRALGWTLAVPEEDRLLHTRPQLEDRLAMLLGGRAAEELVLGDVSTGAADDIERATKLARAMVTRYGMSDVLGPQMLAQSDGEVFLGRDGGPTPREHSEEVAARVDTEVSALLEDAARRATTVLADHRASLERVAEALLERETLHDSDLAELLPAGGTLA